MLIYRAGFLFSNFLTVKGCSIKKQYKVKFTLTVLLILIFILTQGISLLSTQNIFASKREGLMYIVNRLSDTVSALHTNTNTVGSPIAVGKSPYGIAFDPAHNRMYVTNACSTTVSVIDTNTNTVVGSPIEIFAPPDGIAFDPAHNRMYVASGDFKSVLPIDTNINREVGWIAGL